MVHRASKPTYRQGLRDGKLTCDLLETGGGGPALPQSLRVLGPYLSLQPRGKDVGGLPEMEADLL